MKVEKYKGNEIELAKEQIKDVRNVFDVVRVERPLIAESYESELIKMFVELNNFANVKHKMNQSQIIETVKMLFQEYPRLSLQEYALFFRRVKTGFYGQLYESLDGIKIMAFMKDYYKEVSKEFNMYDEETHFNRKINSECRDIHIYYNQYNNDNTKD